MYLYWSLNKNKSVENSYVLDVVAVLFTFAQLPLQSCSVHRKWRLFRSGNLKAWKVVPATCSLSVELLSSCGRGCSAGRISSSIGQPHSSSRRCDVSPAPSCAKQSVTCVPNPAETQHSVCSDVSGKIC